MTMKYGFYESRRTHFSALRGASFLLHGSIISRVIPDAPRRFRFPAVGAIRQLC
jgi:hypothetical protein